MKHVRTARSYQALTVTHDGKEHRVTSAPVEVSNEAADAIEKAAKAAGITVEVSDEKLEAKTATFVGSSIAPDLSRGIGSISGHGAPVETFAATPDAGEPAEQEAAPAGSDAQGDAAASSTTTTTSTTTTKGK